VKLPIPFTALQITNHHPYHQYNVSALMGDPKLRSRLQFGHSWEGEHELRMTGGWGGEGKRKEKNENKKKKIEEKKKTEREKNKEKMMQKGRKKTKEKT
jgi:hypothetical protein